LPVEGVAVVVDGIDTTARNTLAHECQLLGRLGLLADVGVTAWSMSGENCGSDLAAQVTVYALVGNVILAGDVLWRSVLEIVAWHLVGLLCFRLQDAGSDA
jgi:hypothetical protein